MTNPGQRLKKAEQCLLAADKLRQHTHRQLGSILVFDTFSEAHYKQLEEGRGTVEDLEKAIIYAVMRDEIKRRRDIMLQLADKLDRDAGLLLARMEF